MVDASVLGISIQEGGNTPVLLLFPHNTRSILSIKVGALEAHAISTALSARDASSGDNALSSQIKTIKGHVRQDKETPDVCSRPLMHQLLERSIQSLGGHLIAVELFVNDENELASALILRGHRSKERLECRPCDGIALAVRCGAKVRLSEDMAAEADDIAVVLPALSEDLKTVVAAKLLTLHDDPGLAPLRDSLIFSSLQKIPGRMRKAMVDVSRRLIRHSREGKPLAALAGNNEALTGAKQTDKTERTDRASLRGNLPAGQSKPGLPVPKTSGMPVPASRPASPKHVYNSDGSTTMEAVVVPGQTIVLPNPQGTGKGPTIRISLVRQGDEEKTKALDALLFPDSGIAEEALGGLSLSKDEVKAIGNANSEDDRLATLLRLLSPETKVPM